MGRPMTASLRTSQGDLKTAGSEDWREPRLKLKLIAQLLGRISAREVARPTPNDPRKQAHAQETISRAKGK